MVNIGNTSGESQIALHDDLQFIESQDVAAGESSTAAYTIEGPDGYLIGVDSGTPLAPEFRDANGDKLDPSTQITIQKADKQGNPLGDGIVFNDQLGRFDYTKMRTDPDYFRSTNKPLMIDEREIVKVFVAIPDGANGFDASNSRLTIGDTTSDYGAPVEIVDHDDLSGEELQAVKMASQQSSGGD